MLTRSVPRLLQGHNTLTLASRCLATAASTQMLDLVVIGGGPGGYTASIRAGQLGLKVACVEKRGTLGGTCLNVGCIPSKSLLNSTHFFHQAKSQSASMGVMCKEVTVDVKRMMDNKSKTVTALTRGIEGLFRKNKVIYEKGTAQIVGPNEVSIKDPKGKVKSLKTKRILIATGSDVMGVPGTNIKIDEKKIVSSTGALSLPAVPKRLVVIGGGYIGLEMASVWSRLGAKVTVVEFLERIVPMMDLETGNQLHKLLQKQGFEFKLAHKVTSAVAGSAGVTLAVQPLKQAKGGAGKPTQISADVVLVATGRKPYTQGLGLEKLRVAMDGPRIKIDKQFRTNIPSIYAVGDVVPGPMLAHKAEEEGVACVEMMAGRKGHVNYGVIPSVIYTHPEVGSVGKTEEELKAAKKPYKVGKFPFLANSRARCNNDIDGQVKILTDPASAKLLGVHIIGPNAGEMIAEAAVAMENGLTARDVAKTCHAHPTLSEAFREACMASYDKPLNF